MKRKPFTNGITGNRFNWVWIFNMGFPANRAKPTKNCNSTLFHPVSLTCCSRHKELLRAILRLYRLHNGASCRCSSIGHSQSLQTLYRFCWVGYGDCGSTSWNHCCALKKKKMLPTLVGVTSSSCVTRFSVRLMDTDKFKEHCFHSLVSYVTSYLLHIITKFQTLQEVMWSIIWCLIQRF